MIENTEENCEKELLVIDLRKANWFGLLTLLAAVVIFGIPYYGLWSEQFTLVHIKASFRDLATRYSYLLGLIPLGVIAAGIVFHELIHGLTWSLFTRNGHRSIKYGILWKYATPYCHCKEPLEVRHYILGALMPAIVLGILPSVTAVITGNFYLLAGGIFFIMTATGDFMIVHLLRNKEKTARVLDHPSEAGCYIYRQIPQRRPE
ncbi:DUF3267 domain-containing protein [Niabella drilacis]|uniref:Putative zincin peptidase n=1 Tax=Niabella drilacis (strain DSM 25811 / CCM 8410 / CCUG 62505 / LMG 26954 / E90) TaxID=1285928 RepID=A0A1G6YMJ1_NIADE|nr:DUF3267 domain-containing protein [Niabella drilacis]SDD91542.1 Putative zincin peptidase [Niabella drilacis]